MQVHRLHSWQLSITQAQEMQRHLATLVSRKNELVNPQLIAGVDISAKAIAGLARGAVVILSHPELTVVEVALAEAKPNFPYVPGLLSFRESPLILAACEKLSITPHLILADGQGIAHPRRMGLASHLGLCLDVPTIGCAKSILCGKHDTVASEAGSFTELVDDGEIIGAALRTKEGMKPVYVSIGHKVDLATAIYWVKECCRGYRIPEPCRLAHLAATGQLPPTVRDEPQLQQYREDFLHKEV